MEVERFSAVKLKWWEKIVCGVLKYFVLPKHVAFIMDGNRRFAQKQNLKLETVYNLGYKMVARNIKACDILGIRELTLYAFSKENFKRSKADCGEVLHVLENVFTMFLDDFAFLKELDLRFRITGEVELLPPKLQELIARLVSTTQNHHRLTVNIAMAYSSVIGMTKTFRAIGKDVQNDTVRIDEIDTVLMDRYMYQGICTTPPDLLIRTSGEVRFSDFLLWELGGAYCHFETLLWPQLTIWAMARCVFRYHKFAHKIKRIQNYYIEETLFTQSTPHEKNIRGCAED